MLKSLKEYRMFMEITGFRDVKVENANALVNAICEEMPEGVEVQLFDASLVASWEHLYYAALNACGAFQAGRNLSKSHAMEAMLYASARRQIKKALDFFGVKQGTSNVAVLLLGKDISSVSGGFSLLAKWFDKKPDESVLDLSEEKRKLIGKAFVVSNIELNAVSVNGNGDQALVNLIIERVALLSTKL
jgi:tRNA threonylcarbamoyladenosine modification (KEOPS) complex Cgi121 subunit